MHGLPSPVAVSPTSGCPEEHGAPNHMFNRFQNGGQRRRDAKHPVHFREMGSPDKRMDYVRLSSQVPPSAPLQTEDDKNRKRHKR